MTKLCFSFCNLNGQTQHSMLLQTAKWPVLVPRVSKSPINQLFNEGMHMQDVHLGTIMAAQMVTGCCPVHRSDVDSFGDLGATGFSGAHVPLCFFARKGREPRGLIPAVLLLQRFRFATSLVYSGSVALEFLTPMAPQYFLLLASIANVGKSVGLATHISTQPSFVKNFARQDNLSDLTAKAQVCTG